jgi:hypothetical protein
MHHWLQYLPPDVVEFSRYSARLLAFVKNKACPSRRMELAGGKLPVNVEQTSGDLAEVLLL